MEILQVITYASGLIFILGFARKLLKYWTMPMHVRWELYPVPHEGKAHGGSFFEEVDFWKKERHKDHMAQYAFMVPEILFIKALKEDNPKLWYWSFPFHMGLYIAIGGLVFLTIGAVLQIFGLPPESSSLAAAIQWLSVALGLVGFVLGAIGAIGLLFKRLGDQELADSSAPLDYINLVWLAAIFITGFLVWLGDPQWAVSRGFMVSLLTFNAIPLQQPLSTMHVINLLLFAGFWAYFPFTHMTHMVSKYFMWDKVKWDDNPNVGDPGMDAKIGEYLGYPVTWAAAHIEAEGGKKTWADVAMANPWEKEAK